MGRVASRGISLIGTHENVRHLQEDRRSVGSIPTKLVHRIRFVRTKHRMESMGKGTSILHVLWVDGKGSSCASWICVSFTIP